MINCVPAYSQLIKNIYQIKLRICQNIFYFRLFMLQSDCFSFDNTRTANHFLFLQNSWVGILIQSFASSLYTAIGNASKKEPLCSCYEQTSRARRQLNGMAAEKRGFWLSGKSVNMQLFLKDSHGL